MTLVSIMSCEIVVSSVVRAFSIIFIFVVSNELIMRSEYWFIMSNVVNSVRSLSDWWASFNSL